MDTISSNIPPNTPALGSDNFDSSDKSLPASKDLTPCNRQRFGVPVLSMVEIDESSNNDNGNGSRAQDRNAHGGGSQTATKAPIDGPVSDTDRLIPIPQRPQKPTEHPNTGDERTIPTSNTPPPLPDIRQQRTVEYVRDIQEAFARVDQPQQVTSQNMHESPAWEPTVAEKPQKKSWKERRLFKWMFASRPRPWGKE